MFTKIDITTRGYPGLANVYSSVLAKLFACVRFEQWRLLRRAGSAFATILVGLLPAIAICTEIVVTANTPPDIRDDQRCSLIEAISNANSDNGMHSDCVAGSGDDLIVLPPLSSQVLTAVHNFIYGATGLPVITSRITIEGNESTVVRQSGAPSFRIFAVANGAELQLQNINISGGASLLFGSPLQGGGIGYGRPWQGGGVLNYGTLEVNNSNFSNNTAEGSGGGIHSEGGTLVVRDSFLSGNSAQGPGGAISQVRNSGTLLNNECSENVAGLDGGCMWAGAASAVTVTNDTIRGNSGHAGGGLRAEWDTFLVVNYCTVSQNLASGGGGGVSAGAHSTVLILNTTVADNEASAYGGGVLAGGSLTLVKNSTISGNVSPRGGGIITTSRGITGGSATVMSSTITFNEASVDGGGILNLALGPLYLSHSLIAGNTLTNQPSEVHDRKGTAFANAFNLFGYNGNAALIGLEAGPKDIIAASNISAILDTELRNNGGLTATHAIVAGSPAIDSGDPHYSTTGVGVGVDWMYDQRGPGFLRFNSGNERNVDIGSFEIQ